MVGVKVTVAVGTMVVSCACEAPILAPLLYFLGMNSLGVSAVISSLAKYQGPLVLVMTGLNAISSLYYLRLMGSPSFRVIGGKAAITAPQGND